LVRIGKGVQLNEQQHKELTQIAQSRALSAGYVFRAKLILMLNGGATFAPIRERLETTNPTIIRWKERFLAAGMDGLDTSHPGQQPYRLTTKLRAKVLNATRKKPSDGSTHWSCRKLAKFLGISKDLVHRIWQEAGINRIGWSATWPAMIRTSRRKPLTSSASTFILRSTRPCFVWMRRAPFRHSIASTRCCH